MNTANNQSKQQINTAALRGTREAHQPDEFQTPISLAATAACRLHGFINPRQLEVIGDCCRGEEGEFFKNKLVELAGIVDSMPVTYATDGIGDAAIVHLHYFNQNFDWYITERDVEEEQLQAFGLACLWEQEQGYISIAELNKCGADFDLSWEPKTLSQVKAERQMQDVNYPGHPTHY